jgi:hypothetical protein
MIFNLGMLEDQISEYIAVVNWGERWGQIYWEVN